MTNCLQIIGSKPIAYKNAFPPIKWALLSQRQVDYFEYVIFTRDTVDLGMSRREVINMISDIGKEISYVQSDNHLDSLILSKRLTNIIRHGRVIKYHATTTERLHIFVSQ